MSETLIESATSVAFGQIESMLAALIELVQFAPHAVPARNDIGQRRAVFALHPLELRQPLFYLLQVASRGVNPIGVAAQKQREILELRLDAVARVDVRNELRIERREFPHSPPDLTQTGKDGVVALVERGVALGAQALDVFRIRQDCPPRTQLLVFTHDQRGAILQ